MFLIRIVDRSLLVVVGVFGSATHDEFITAELSEKKLVIFRNQK